MSDRAGTWRGGKSFPRGVIFPSNSCYEPYIISKELRSFGVHSTDAHSHTHTHTPRCTDTLTQRRAHSVERKFSLCLFHTRTRRHTFTHTHSPSCFALPVSISCHLKSRTAGASGSRRGARLTGNGPHSLIRLPCSCPSSATLRMSSPGGMGLVEGGAGGLGGEEIERGREGLSRGEFPPRLT